MEPLHGSLKMKNKNEIKKGCRQLCIGGFALLAVIASLAGIPYIFQDMIVFQPNAVPLNDYMPPVPHENVYIHTKDGVKLNLILLPYTGGNSSAPTTILYFHGNAGSIYDRVFNALQMLVKLKANVVLVEYRGFGKSEGKPSEEGLYLDAEATLDYVMTRPDLNYTKVVLFGRSLGGAVAVLLASVNPHRVAAIIVENTFLSIPHMAATFVPFLPMRLLPLWYYRNQFLSYQHVAQCHMPSLFVSGLSDRLIPPVMMKQLYELSPAQNKRLATFPGGTHMNTRICQGYFPALEQFIKDMLKSHTLEEISQTSAVSNSSQIFT